MTRFFSDRNRPVHLGPFPMEGLARTERVDLSAVPTSEPVRFHRPEAPESIVNAMRDYQATLDVIRDGIVNPVASEIPSDPVERANHLKAFGYFNDAAMVGICRLPDVARLSEPVRNPDIDRLAEGLQRRQTKTLASGIDVIMADLKDSIAAPLKGVEDHTHAIVYLYENPREPGPDEEGCDWLRDALAARACLRAAETASVIANYLRLLGVPAKAHSGAAADVDLNRLTVAAGLATVQDGRLVAPFLGERFGVAVVTCRMDLACDRPLADRPGRGGLAWAIGKGVQRSALNRNPYERRRFMDGGHPFERIRRVDTPTTYIDEANVPRVPKRTDMFARALFGDMGKTLQEGAKGGAYVLKSAPSHAQRRALGAFVVIQNGEADPDGPRPADAVRNAANIKAASYFLGADAVGLSRCPDWAWYSHDATGAPIDPPHDQAISMIIDQGRETMEGSSGDDWIAVAQSMRAYLRFSLLGGVIAQQIRNLGYSAKAHTVMDGEVLQPPLLLLSGLGEVSRIGEVILHPYLGPRLKSGVVTTDMPLAHDKPIDFGLQAFCETCNKCARECPSGAITAGPKRMFNGYEIWKSDSQRCATYRITTKGGAMCGRCMKTCPWNLEGIFAERPARWAAMTLPRAAPLLAKLDDAAGRGGLNDAKTWWWDLERAPDGAYRPTRHPVNRRGLQPELRLRHEDQTLAVYPAPLAPHPWPYPFPMDREKGIAAYRALVGAEEHKARLLQGERDHLHRYEVPGDAPVIQVEVAKAEAMTPDVTKYEFRAVEGGDLPDWTAGAHLDIVVAPEYLRQYSMSGDPADRSVYQVGVLREDEGRGGSKLMHRVFTPGRRVFVSKPINHFALDPTATRTLLMAGGIGVTPMIAFAHTLHRAGGDFALHYSCSTRDEAGFLDDLAAVPWAERVHLHVSDEGTRADLDSVLGGYRPGWHVYTCGPERYMRAVLDAAERAGFPEAARHLEYFSVPEQPDYENHPFKLRLRDGRVLDVPADRNAAEVLRTAGIPIDIKCEDGLCGVCQCGVIAGAVEHRDVVLSRSDRGHRMMTCCSRAAQPGGVIDLDL